MADAQQDNIRDEEFKEIFSEFNELKKQEAERKQEDKKNNDLRFKTRRVITLLGMVLSVMLFFNLAGIIFAKNSPLRSPRPWAVGERLESDYKIDGCIFRLWRIRKAIDLYYADKKKFPENMQQLYETGFLKQKTLCPASQKGYVFGDFKSAKVFRCPEPSAHQVDIMDIYCNVISSPPMIKRINDGKEAQPK